jgi:streptogramin lyase
MTRTTAAAMFAVLALCGCNGLGPSLGSQPAASTTQAPVTVTYSGGAPSTASSAQTVQYQIYTLTVGDSTQSYADNVLFDGHFIWVAIQNPDGGVLEKMTTAGSLVSTTSVGTIPDSLAYDGANVWVTNYSSGSVSVVSSSGQLLNTIAIPGSPSTPEGIAFDGEYIWVANDSSANSVTKIEAKTQTIVGTYSVGRAPDALTFDGRSIWVANSYSAQVTILDPGSGATVNGYATGVFPTDMLYDGKNIWIANGFAANLGFGSVTKIRAADGASEGTFTIPGKQLRGLAYDDTSIWVCNAYSNTVTRLNASNVTLMGTFPTGTGPRGAAYDGTKIWIANSGQNTLTIIVPPAGTPGYTAASTADVSTLAKSASTTGTLRQLAPTPAASLAVMFNLLLGDQ